MERFKRYASFVKLEHTIFSLPLIYAGALLAGKDQLNLRLIILILLAASGGRVTAMGLNRLIDAEIDRRNPRTKMRELPRGVMGREEAWALVAVAAAVYVGSAAAIAPICLWLSPIPLILFVIYPYLKRVTTLSHMGLGLTWSMAPLGGWLAVSQSFEPFWQITWLWLFSILWVAGFDIIYATMDEAFDREFGLHSLPAKFGKTRALGVAAILHLEALVALALLWWMQLRRFETLVWLLIIGIFLAWQHVIARREPEVAFFQINALVGFLVLGFVMLGV